MPLSQLFQGRFRSLAKIPKKCELFNFLNHRPAPLNVRIDIIEVMNNNF